MSNLHLISNTSPLISLYLYGDSNSKTTSIVNKDYANFSSLKYLYYDHVVSENPWFIYVRDLVVGSHVDKVPSSGFGTALSHITLMTSNDAVIPSGAFKEKIGIEDVTVLTGVIIEKDAFLSSTIGEINLTDKTKIESGAFSKCKKLDKIYVNYNSKPDQQLVADDAFDSDVYENTVVIQTGTYDASEDSPWNKFTHRESIIGTTCTIDRLQDAVIESTTANKVDMPLQEENTDVFIMSFPFPVSTYYFGADATVYNLDQWTNDFESKDGGFDMLLPRFDIDSQFEFPANTPLLIINPHKESLVKGTVDLFNNSMINVDPKDYESEKSWGNNGPFVIQALSKKSTCPFNDRNVFVLDDGCFKRVNSADYQIPAFGVTVSSPVTHPNISISLCSKETQKEIIPSHASVTPNKYLEGYVTFYNEMSDFEIYDVENGNIESEVYTVTGIVEDGTSALKLHKVEDGIINKGEAVLIKAKAGTELKLRMVTNGSSDTEAYEENVLRGVIVDTPVSDLCTDGCDFIYVLSCDANYKNVGFYQYSSQKTLGAYKAYIPASALGGAGAAKAFLFSNEETGIDCISDDGNGASSIYDLNGRKVSNMQKNNIYIIDNKKTILK